MAVAPLQVQDQLNGVVEIERAREQLKQVDASIRDNVLPEFRSWRRMLRRAPEPLPEECKPSGAAVLLDLHSHATSALEQIVRAFGGTRPAWAGPLHGIVQQAGALVESISSPCQDMLEVTLAGLEFLATAPHATAELDARLQREVADRSNPPRAADLTATVPRQPRTAPKKRGRPKTDPRKFAIAQEIESHHNSFDCTWEEACEAIGRIRGQKYKPNTVRSWLRRARLRESEAQAGAA